MSEEELVYTDQTAFTAMRKHVLSMTERCYSESANGCLYNGKTSEGEDNHCAVGALLKGITISDFQNTCGIHYLISNIPEVDKRIGRCNMKLLLACQLVHDDENGYFWGHNSLFKKKEAFFGIAERFNLKVEE